ncbi:target of Nesh-SH3 isoform X13 [Stegostoma tigrinum]|uniref:target of Nesh-SH3 isoform X13 n=1 Tax=Stegostoma tigrinum TaxID=3053191 RepID=UPI0028705496|nr:target of Nesh-SH3 isoform X13 [Stegostoma tigrinum]
MSVKFLFVIFGGIVLILVDNARMLPRVKRQSLKVRITAKDDTIILQYLSSNPDIRLQGYIIGHGGRNIKQNLTLPNNGDPFEVDVEFYPKYLIAVHPVAEQSKAALKKKCKGNLNHQKPPQITISTRTATSVFLTWTNGIKGNVYKHGGHNCGDERHYTVRYREKEGDENWLYQCCPTSETTIDNLKPNTVYEFGVRVSKAKEEQEGTWSEPTNYVTAVTSSPKSTEKDQTQKISKKLAINFNSETLKNTRKPELPGKTNIIGIKGKKGPAASYPAQNGTNWIRFPKKPTVNTQVVLGGQSASDSAHDHSTSRSSPKTNLPSKPDRASDQLHGKEEINKLKSKGTSNTVTKPSLKSGKMRNAKEKSKVKPLTTKASKLPSSVSPSFPSKPVPKSGPAEIQKPVFLTPSPPSQLDTTDKQQSTEPVTTPPSTTLPFTVLSTTSGHTAVDKQHLPGTTSALDPVETQKFSGKPEKPSSSHGPFHSTSDFDAVNNQEFTEPEVPSATSSLSSISNLASKLGVTDLDRFKEHEEPSSKDSFSHTTSEPETMDNQQFPEYGVLSSIISNIITLRTTSAPDAVDNQEFTEPEIHLIVDSSPTTSKKYYEFDSTQRKQISVPEFEAPFSSNTPVSNLKTTPLDVMDTKQSKADHEVPTSLNVFTLISDRELPITDSPYMLNSVSESDPAQIREDEFTDQKMRITNTGDILSPLSHYELPVTDSPHVIRPIPEPAMIGKDEFADQHVPTPDTPNVISLISERKLLVTDTPNIFKPILESEPAETAEKEVTADREVSTSDTRNVFSSVTDYEVQVTDSPHFINSIPESEPTKIGKDELTDHHLPTPDTPNVFSLISEYKPFVTDTPNIFNPTLHSEPARTTRKEGTGDHEVPTSDTYYEFSSISDYELPVTDSPRVLHPVPGPEPAKIGKDRLTDHHVPTRDAPSVFSLASEYNPPVTGILNVFKPILQSESAEIAEKELTAAHEVQTSDIRNVASSNSDNDLLVTDSPYVFHPVSGSDPAKMRKDKFTDYYVPTHSVFNLISEYKVPITDTPNVFKPILEPERAEIAEKEVTADHEVPTSNNRNVVSSKSDHELPVTDLPNVLHLLPGSDPAKIGKEEFTDHHLPTRDSPSVFSLISEYKQLVTDTPNVFKPVIEFEPTEIAKKEVTDYEVPISDTLGAVSSESDYELPVTDSPYVLHPVPGSEPAKIGKEELTDQHVPAPATPSVFSLITEHKLPVTDSPNIFKPVVESETAEIVEKEETADHEVTTSDTQDQFSFISGTEMLITDSPNVLSPNPDSESANIEEKEITESELPVTDTPNVFKPVLEYGPAEIAEKEGTDHEVLTSDSPSMFRSVSDYDLSITGSPYVLNPIAQPETAKIGKDKITDHKVPTSDTPNVFSSISESERAKIGKKEVTADHVVATSHTRYTFSSISDNELPVTDNPDVFNPIPESEPAKIGMTEDYGVSTSRTAVVPSPSPVHETGEKELTDNKLTHPDTSHAFIPTLGHIEDKEITAHVSPKSDTPRKFSSTPVSELDNKKDEKFTEHELPMPGTPDVFIQTQESVLDKIEDKDLTEYLFPTSDIPHGHSSTSAQPPFDSSGKVLTESDPPSERSPVITTKRVQKPDTKQKFTEPGTQSPGGHLSSTFPGSTQESSPVFRSTPVSNIDGQGKERFRGPYVKYMTKPDMPCSITESLKHFPQENITNNKAAAPPRYAPSNLTLVTVEGCPTFLIVDWESNENDTASEYEVVSTMQGSDNKTEELITITNQTHAAVENLKPNTSYTFSVTPTNIHGRGPSSEPLPFVTESADPSVSEYIPGKDAIWTQYSFKFDSYSECQGKRFVKRTRYRKFVGIILCNSLRYKIYLSNSLSGIFYNIGDLSGHGEDHCQFVDSFLDGRTGEHLLPEQLPIRQGFYRSVRQEPVMFGTIGGRTHINYVHWYECGIAIPGQW